MKTLFNGLICASLLFFVSCGKDNSSGGGGSKNYKYGEGLSMPAQDAMKFLTVWHNGSAEAFPQQNLVKRTSVYNTQPTCEDKKFLGIPYTQCKYNGTPSTSDAAHTVTYDTRNVAIKSKNNPELNAIFNGSAGRIIDAHSIGGSKFQISILKNDGSIVIYGIDTQRHSSLNPEFKSVTSQSQRIDTQIL